MKSPELFLILGLANVPLYWLAALALYGDLGTFYGAVREWLRSLGRDWFLGGGFPDPQLFLWFLACCGLWGGSYLAIMNRWPHLGTWVSRICELV